MAQRLEDLLPKIGPDSVPDWYHKFCKITDFIYDQASTDNDEFYQLTIAITAHMLTDLKATNPLIKEFCKTVSEIVSKQIKIESLMKQ